MRFLRWRQLAGLLALIALAGTQCLAAAAGPMPSGAILQELKRFQNTGSVLYVAAHPDDENTELITWLSRGRGYRTAYLSLTRGDGGQNELGRDFDEKLGVLRTQELLAARRLDGGRQFFTRAIDFGYSKTPEETLRFWDHDQVLSDVVRVIRQFRPDVMVTRFPVPPGSGGHGHHTASAILAVEAFKLAGNPTAYPEQLAQGLQPWQPKRILWNVFRPGGNAKLPLDGATFQQDIAGTDAVTGEPFGALAARSRAMHKTQGLGGFTSRNPVGPNMQTFLLLAGEPATADLMDGVEATWARFPGGAEIGALATAALVQFKPDDPAASVPALLAIRQKLAALPADAVVTDRRTQLDLILQACLGLHVVTTVDRPEAVPGESITITTSRSNSVEISGLLTGRRFFVNDRNVEETITFPGHTNVMPPGVELFTDHITIPKGTPLTQPYWLREDGAAGLARVSDLGLIGRPENPPALRVEADFSLGGQTLTLSESPVFVAGETRRRLDVIPPVSLAFGSEIFLIAPGATKPVTVEIAAARAGAAGTLSVEAPTGWRIAPATQSFDLKAAGSKARFTFDVTAPASSTPGRLIASAKVGGQRFSNERVELRYDHLPVQLLQPPARARLASFPLAIRSHTVGYLPGAGDSVAECLIQMGCTVRPLTGADLTPAKLAGLDAVVIGVRAFNERSDLAAAFPGLLAWVEAGGTVIAQYNRPNGLKAPQLGPYALSIAGPAPQLRVTDETAPVTFLAPTHPALTAPNLLTPAEFTGWVQERGAYFPSAWDEKRYVALLAMNDPGEAPLRGSLLVAAHGKGYYVYTGLAFFRQLPTGVPSAWHLFANLLSLGK